MFFADVDVPAQIVRAGLAWHDKAHEREQNPQERAHYAAFEDVAHQQRRGVWSDPSIMRPAECRQMKLAGARARARKPGLDPTRRAYTPTAMAESSIEWTEYTWNPVTGCTKVSPGCKNCYAETMARRLKAMGAAGYENGFQLTLHEDRLEQPLRRRRSTTYFVNSMSDLFHEKVSDNYIERVLDVCQQTPQHTYQVLTKRAERLPKFFAGRTVPSNVWLGVSVEDRRHGVPRIDLLRQVHAGVRFLSVEPLLEDLGPLDLSGLHWIIVGGESGHHARPMQPEWAESVRRQAVDQRVPFFFKQWGAWGSDGVRRDKKSNGRVLTGKVWDQFPVTAVSSR